MYLLYFYSGNILLFKGWRVMLWFVLFDCVIVLSVWIIIIILYKKVIELKDLLFRYLFIISLDFFVGFILGLMGIWKIGFLFVMFIVVIVSNSIMFFIFMFEVFS